MDTHECQSPQHAWMLLVVVVGRLLSLWGKFKVAMRSLLIRTLISDFLLVFKPEGKRPLGRPRRRWEDNIKMDLKEVGRGCGDWMELAHDRDRWWALVSTVMNFRVP